MDLPLAARFELTPAPGVGAGGGAAASSKSAQSLSRAFRPAAARRSWYGHSVRRGTSRGWRAHSAHSKARGQAALRPRYVQRKREAGTTQPAHVSAQAAGRRRGPRAPRPRRRWTRPAAAERGGRSGAAAQGAHATDSSVNIAQQWAGGASRGQGKRHRARWRGGSGDH